jgi:hypothetical protein
MVFRKVTFIMEKTFTIVFCLFVFSAFSQEKSDLKTTFSGYLETYYSYDFNPNGIETKLPFMYNHNRHNEFNVNIGLLRTKFEYGNMYANIAIQSGAYVVDNYASEKIQNINEAFIGIYFDTMKKHVLEAGILPSYIGFESATTATNLTLTRSILAENSPYFMTGIKYNFKPSDKWIFAALLTNGWQRIAKPNKNLAPSFGSQIVYKPSEEASFNWSTFVGKEFNGTSFDMRYFSNLFFDQKWNSKWRTIAGFDLGVQKLSNNQSATWLSPVIIVQYEIHPKWQTAFRAEYYKDAKNVIIATSVPFETTGFSFNIDYLPNAKVKLRNEIRYLNNKNSVFGMEPNLMASSLFTTTSLSFEF